MDFDKFAKLDENGNIVLPPHSAPLPQGGTLFNCHRDPAWLAANGFREHSSEWFGEHTPQPEVPDDSAFRAACGKFRMICTRLGQAIGKADFKEGFDEMADYQQSAVYSTLAGLQLAMAWSAANELCKYEGAKIGLGQPAWWYKCWEA